MRGVYTAEIKLTAWAGTKSMILIEAPSLKAVELISAHIGCVGTNVTNQQLEAKISRVTTLGSPTGTAITPTPEEIGDKAADSTVLSVANTNGTDVTTISATASLDHQGFASLAGYQYAPVPEERGLIPPAGNAVLYLPVAPGVASDMVVQVKFREIG